MRIRSRARCMPDRTAPTGARRRPPLAMAIVTHFVNQSSYERGRLLAWWQGVPRVMSDCTKCPITFDTDDGIRDSYLDKIVYIFYYPNEQLREGLLRYSTGVDMFHTNLASKRSRPWARGCLTRKRPSIELRGCLLVTMAIVTHWLLIPGGRASCSPTLS
jgi:hypothetical protein